MFPFKEADSIFVKISFRLGENKLAVEKWADPEQSISLKETYKRVLHFYF
jgi:hypothetical protein